MKKLLSIIAIAVVFCFGALAQDFGGTVDNATSLGMDPTFSISDAPKLSFWFKTKLGQYYDLFLQVSSQASFALDTQGVASGFSYGMDIDTLQFSGRIPAPQAGLSEMSLSLGRMFVADATQNVFAHRLDGISLGFIYPNLQFTFTFGYTGLFWKTASAVLMSNTDLLYVGLDETILGSPRFIGLAEMSLPYILGHSATLSLVVQEDLEDTRDAGNYLIEEGTLEVIPGRGGPVDTQYASLAMAGPIFGDLYYDGFFTFGTGRVLSYMADEDSSTGYSYQYAPIVSFLGGGGLRFYLEEFLFSAFGLRAVYSSGDADSATLIEGNTAGYSETFTPITAGASGIAFSPLLGNVSFVELSYSLKPLAGSDIIVFQNVQTMIRAMTFFRSTVGAISQPGIDPDSQGLYLGTEADVMVNFRPFSDLGSSLAVGFFLPGLSSSLGAFDPSYFNGLPLQIRGSVSFSFSF